MLRQRIAISNATNDAATLFVEPWGEEIALPPGARVTLEFHGPEGEIEVEYGVSRIVVYGWAGSTYEGVVEERERS